MVYNKIEVRENIMSTTNNGNQEKVVKNDVKEKIVYFFNIPVLTIKKTDKNNEKKYYLFNKILIMAVKED